MAAAEMSVWSSVDGVWERNVNRCYLWSTNEKTLAQAEDFCQREGGHLASVSTSDIDDYINQGFESHNLDTVWIGGTDVEEEGTCKWADCSPWNYTLWGHGEPNNLGGDEDCLEQINDSAGRWNDDDCPLKKAFVCSKKICSGTVGSFDLLISAKTTI